MNANKLSLFVTFALIASATARLSAQVKAPKSLALDQALELALSTSKQLRIANAALDQAEAEEMRARSAYFPSLSGGFGYTRTLESEYRALAGLPSSFAPDHKYELGMSATQPVFTGGRITAQLHMAAAARRTKAIDLASVSAQLIMDVTQGYLSAALADRLVEIAQATLARADTALSQTRTANSLGTQADFDVLRAQVARDNERVNLIRQRSDRDIAHLRLKKLLSVPADTQLVLTSSLDSEVQSIILAAYDRGVAEKPTMPLRAPVLEATEAVHIAEEQVRAARSGHLPSLLLTTQFGRVNYPVDGKPRWNDFRSNWIAGVSFQLPLFQGGKVVAEGNAAEAALAEARARLEQVRDYAELDFQQAVEKLAAAQAEWDASRGTVDQAITAYRIAEVRYREGVSTQIELADSRLLLQQAEINRARASANLRIAQTRMAIIHELPIEY